MPRFASVRARLTCAPLLVAFFLIAGCAHQTGADAQKYAKNSFWSGRLALQVESTPPQAFFAGFELQGNARAGELLLFSPLGSTLAALSWTPDSAQLRQGGAVRAFDSVDALVRAATGAAFPVTALFAWLDGDAVQVAGWRADLSRLSDGRLSAARSDPQPPAELKLVLQQP